MRQAALPLFRVYLPSLRRTVANIVRSSRLFLSERNPPQDVNQSLVDDGLVDMDKIGSSNFFWSFPSKVAVTKQNRVDSLKQNIVQVYTVEEGLLPCKRGAQSRFGAGRFADLALFGVFFLGIEFILLVACQLVTKRSQPSMCR